MKARRVISILMLLALSSLSAWGVEIAVPPNFPHMTVTQHDTAIDGLFYSASPTTSVAIGDERPYAYVVNAEGEVVWFRTEDYHNRIFPHYANNRIMYVARQYDIDEREVVVLDDGGNVDTTVLGTRNALYGEMFVDQHEVTMDAEGNLFTQWRDPQIVDMSVIVPGGDPEANVKHHTIQKWAPDGELLWEWRSFDHVDELPYTLIEDPDILLDPGFSHMHINSVQVMGDGDLLMNSRQCSMVFRVDYPSGEIEWILGGGANQFDFFTNLPEPDNEPLRFSWAHTAWLHDNGHLTLYDNGKLHDPRVTYFREYVLDIDAMTAELIWNVHLDSAYTGGAGSLQVLDPPDQRLIGWGGINRPHSAQVINTNGTPLWTIDVLNSATPNGTLAPCYRWYRIDTLPPDDRPYLCAQYQPAVSTAGFFANWFGHEDEVDGWEIWLGSSYDDLAYWDTTDDGVYAYGDIAVDGLLFARAVPIDSDGEPVGPPSNIFKARPTYRDLMLFPESSPAPGDTLRYLARFRSQFNEPLTLTVEHRLGLPDGSWTDFQYVSEVDIQDNSRTSLEVAFPIPDNYPEDQYVLETRAMLDLVPFDITRVEFDVGQGLAVADRPRVLPRPFALLPAYPNPFNPSTTVRVDVPVRSEVTVTVSNLLGRQVMTLADGSLRAGIHAFTLDGSRLASGVYLVRATVPGQLDATHRITLVK